MWFWTCLHAGGFTQLFAPKTKQKFDKFILISTIIVYQRGSGFIEKGMNNISLFNKHAQICDVILNQMMCAQTTLPYVYFLISNFKTYAKIF